MADKIQRDLGREWLKQNFGVGSDLYAMLEHYSMDTAFMISPGGDDFMGDTLHGTYQTTGAGGGSAAAIATGTVNGAINLASSATDDGSSDLSLGLHFRGDRNPLMIARLAIDTITTVKVEVGWTDVISGTDVGAVLVKATPTFTAADCAVWILDTDDNANWEGVAADSGTAATTVEAAISPTAATYEYLGVALLDGIAYYYRWDANGRMTFGDNGGVSNRQSAAISSDVLLTPWIFAQSRSAAAHTVTVDWWGAWQRRTT